jgi:hypothetical protein
MDYILIAIIVAGIGLSGAYLRAELVLHRRTTALQRARELVQRDVHAERVCLGQNDAPGQSRTVPWSIPNAFRPMRVLARALRIYIQEPNIHRFRIRT